MESCVRAEGCPWLYPGTTLSRPWNACQRVTASHASHGVARVAASESEVAGHLRQTAPWRLSQRLRDSVPLAKPCAPVAERARGGAEMTPWPLPLTGCPCGVEPAIPAVAPTEAMNLVTDRLAPPSAKHLLGADGAGRDILTRLIHGARISLVTARGWETSWRSMVDERFPACSGLDLVEKTVDQRIHNGILPSFQHLSTWGRAGLSPRRRTC